MILNAATSNNIQLASPRYSLAPNKISKALELNKIKRPLNSFMLFKKLNYDEIKRLVEQKFNGKTPESKSLGAEISKEAGRLWKSLAPEHRLAFIIAAKNSMAEYTSKKKIMPQIESIDLGCLDSSFKPCWTPVTISMLDDMWNT